MYNINNFNTGEKTMDYVTATLEGVVTFVSPCLLPLLPVYISWFAGGQDNRKRAFINALGFVLGFSSVFVVLGAFAGTLGRLLMEYSLYINLVSGAIVVLFGLGYLGVLKIPLLNMAGGPGRRPETPGFAPSVLFGIIFSVSWTPCVGALLGSALMLAASTRDTVKGIVMLALYSLGLGIPFVISALLIDRLKGTFDFIKRHYRVVNIISGLLLVLVGILMMTGMLGRLMSILAPA